MQNISPSSFELPEVSATEAERERDWEATEAARDDVGVPENFGLEMESWFLNFELGRAFS